MTNAQSSSSLPVRHLEFRREFNSPRDLVFSVWTSPDHMRHWLHPTSEWSNPVVEVDLRVGGRYRLGFRHPENPDIVFVVGKFLEVEWGVRLVYTWTWEPPDPHAGHETIVTVNFATTPQGGTEVTLTHDRFPDDAVRKRHDEGWKGTLECLERYLEAL